MSVDVAACEREELSRIGLVQPHGGVAVLDAERQHVIAASAGLHRLLDLRTALRPGSPASALPAGLLDELAEFARSGAATAALGHDETDLERQVHRTEDGALVEWIQPTEAPLQGVLAAAAEATAEHLAQQLAATAPNAFGAAQLLAEAAARISGYDRVMVYRFHPDWSGEVVAERRRPDLQPYLGLRYPASDIPPQARALYQRHLLRIVVDVQDVAIPLLHASPVPPDLAPALLRSLSPVHVQYLRNMGVRATLTVSLMHGGRLWGMLALHHGTPRLPPRRLRATLAALARPFEALLDRAAETASARQRGALSEFRRGAEAGDPDDLLARLLLGPDGLASASRADGAAWVGPERVIAVGLTPDPQSLRSLTLQAGEGGEPHASLRLDLPAPRDPRRARPAGMLAMRVGDGCLALFRRELVQEINWGGDPAKAVALGPDGRLSPRRSFALWREEVRGACRPWDDGEDALLRMAAGLLAAGPIGRLEARTLARVAAMVGRTRRGSASLADLLTPQATAILLSGEGPDATVIDVTPGLCALLDTSPAPLHGLALSEAESLLGLTPHGGRREGEAGGPGLYAFHSPDHGQLTLRLDIEPVLQVAAPEATHHCEVLFVDDETRQSRLSAALRSTELQVERARRARDAFLGTTSHELRTPLNAIIGLADLLTEPDLQLAEIHRYASEIGRAGRSMLALVENLLSVARLGTGRFEAKPERLDLADLLRRQAALLEALFQAKAVRLRVDLTRAVPVVTDSSLVGPAVLNLLANALKFTPPGGEVRIELSAATGVAEIAITDTGPGIPKADRVRIFEAFEQGDESVQQRHGGAGLGLFIARNMIAAVGGSLSLRSGRRRGSCFVVRLPSLPDPGGDGTLPD